MELRKAIENRRTVRKFTNAPVSRKKIDSLIDIAQYAPSSCNQRRYAFVAVDDEKVKKRLRDKAGFRHALNCPVIIYILCSKKYGHEKSANIQGLSAGVQNMLLYAQELGLATWWMASCGTRKEIMKILSIPSDYTVLSAVGVGYPEEKPPVPQQRKVSDILHWNKYSSELREASVNPEDWPVKALEEFTSLAIYAKNPEIGYNHAFVGEWNNQIKTVSCNLKKTALIVHDIDGIYSFELAKKNPRCSFTILVYTKEMKEWFDERKKSLSLKNMNFVLSVDKKFDTVLILEVVNRIPLNEVRKILSKYSKMGEKTVISSINRCSVYGLAIRKGLSRRFGPEKSLSRCKFRKLVKKSGLKIRREKGYNIFPSFKIFKRIDVPRSLSSFRGLIRWISKFEGGEKYSTRGPLKIFCTSTIIVAKKK